MCGIIAILSNYYNCPKILIDGLKQLQNRGYDSAGISTLTDKINCLKYASSSQVDSILKLEEELHQIGDSNIGIGHTRWATHGGKTDLNSHPHISNNGKICLVHNGIIENYKQYRDFLIEKNFYFYSETDTEVIVNLIEYNLTHGDCNDFSSAISKTMEKLSGTWGLVIMNLDEPNKLYCVRKGSPLLVSDEGESVIITSEQSGFNGKINNYFILESNDICVVEKKNKTISINCIKNYQLQSTNHLNFDLSPDPYPHWTLKEIYEQYEASKRAISQGGRINGYSVKLGGLEPKSEILKRIDNLILLGCGTSLNACFYAKHHFKELTNFNSISVYNGADFELSDIPKFGSTALVLVSQSGETIDLSRCIELVKERDLFLIGMVNVVDSLIAREVHCGCYLNAGREVAVASTKSFINQSILLTMLAIWFSQLQKVNSNKRVTYIDNLRKLPYDIKNTIDIFESKKDDLLSIIDKKKLFVLGKQEGEAIAKEGALKIKEMSYIFAEGYSSSSLKHGPFALLDSETPVILIAPSDNYLSKNNNTYEEIITRNSKVLFITDNKNDEKPYSIIIPYNKVFGHLISIVPIQLAAYHLSVSKNINPDKPRNLAKCVTVE